MAERPQLRVVDDQGQVHEEQCPNCAGADKEVRAWRTRYANLKREVEGEYLKHNLFPAANSLFDFWRERCNHPRSKFTAERFEQVLPHLRDEGVETCRRAIEGIAYDPYVTQRKNGTAKRHDDWSLLFRNREKLEDFANRAPYHLPKPEHVKALANAIQFLYPDWELNRCVIEAQGRLKR